MDQFTASISETPVDVRVSSEESEELVPFHSFHPFPSLPESEGAYGQWEGGLRGRACLLKAFVSPCFAQLPPGS